MISAGASTRSLAPDNPQAITGSRLRSHGRARGEARAHSTRHARSLRYLQPPAGLR
jgi:hypothetical protein